MNFEKIYNNGLKKGNIGSFWEGNIYEHVKDLLDFLEKNHPEERNRDSIKNLLFKFSDEINQKIIGNYINQGKVLDVGCGICVLYEHLYEKDQYFGIDRFEEWFEFKPRDLSRERLLKLDLRKLEKLSESNFPREYSHIVDCLSTGRHLLGLRDFDFLKFFKKIDRILSKGGRYYFVDKYLSINRKDIQKITESEYLSEEREIEVNCGKKPLTYFLLVFEKRKYSFFL